MKMGEEGTALALVPFCCLTGVPGAILDLMLCVWRIRSLQGVAGAHGTSFSIPLFPSQG